VWFGTPQLIGYRANNATTGALLTDGGFSIGKFLPTSGPVFGNPPGYVTTTPSNGGAWWAPSGNRFDRGFFRNGFFHRAEWMSLDPFVYVDENASGSPRLMTYVWFGGNDAAYRNNNVAGYPMHSATQMDANASSGVRPYAYRVQSDPSLSPGVDFLQCTNAVSVGCQQPSVGDLAWPLLPSGANCLFPNGVLNALGMRIDPNCVTAGVAEGPAAFRRNGINYVLYSRNEWNSPAYGVFYRRSSPGGTIDSIKLAGLAASNTPEAALIVSSNRVQPGGRSYGHGEVFRGPNNPDGSERWYIIFHAKETAQIVGGNPVYPSKFSGRTIFFKELTFNTDGSMQTMTNDPTNLTPAYIGGFIVPAP
jgi:hypothetical protein